MHFCAQELIILLTLMDNSSMIIIWFNTLKEKLTC